MDSCLRTAAARTRHRWEPTAIFVVGCVALIASTATAQQPMNLRVEFERQIRAAAVLSQAPTQQDSARVHGTRKNSNRLIIGATIGAVTFPVLAYLFRSDDYGGFVLYNQFTYVAIGAAIGLVIALVTGH
jgi:hypothetical protein